MAETAPTGDTTPQANRTTSVGVDEAVSALSGRMADRKVLDVALAAAGRLLGEAREGISHAGSVFLERTSAEHAVSTVPDRATAERALRILFHYGVAHQREQYERVVDAVSETNSLDDDQLYQARRHAERKRHLISSLTLLGTDELIELMPDRLARDSNTARTLGVLRDRGQLLGVKLKGDWRYPAVQLDRRGECHRALVPVLARARAQGYDGWETLHWLATPRTARPAPAVPGRPLEPSAVPRSLDEIVAGARERHEAEPPTSDGPAVAPFTLLATDDIPAFERAARRWLGVEPEDRSG